MADSSGRRGLERGSIRPVSFEADGDRKQISVEMTGTEQTEIAE